MGDIRDKHRGVFQMGKNIIVPENKFLKERKKEKEIADAQKLAEELRELHMAKQKEIEEKLETLELMPNGNRIIIMPYPANPYVKVLSEGGIYIAPNANYFNEDTGEIDQAEELVACAKVIEVGPDVKNVQVGDDIYYDGRTGYPLPFMNLGYKIVPETQILVIINENVKSRLKS